MYCTTVLTVCSCRIDMLPRQTQSHAKLAELINCRLQNWRKARRRKVLKLDSAISTALLRRLRDWCGRPASQSRSQRCVQLQQQDGAVGSTWMIKQIAIDSVYSAWLHNMVYRLQLTTWAFVDAYMHVYSPLEQKKKEKKQTETDRYLVAQN